MHIQTISNVCLKLTMSFLMMTFPLFLPQGAIAGDTWLRQVPEGWADQQGVEMIDPATVKEVVHSKASYAEEKVSSRQAIGITAEQAAFFTGSSMPIKEGHRFILVRALFGNGSTGGYRLYESADGAELYVTHNSLGVAPTPTKSALIVQLKKVPKRVFSSLGYGN